MRHMKLVKKAKTDWEEIYIGRLFWLCADQKKEEYYIYSPVLDAMVVIPWPLFEMFKKDVNDLCKALRPEAPGKSEKLGLAKEIEEARGNMAELIQKERGKRHSEQQG